MSDERRDYSLQQLVRHLIQGGHAARVLRLLLSFEWLETKIVLLGLEPTSLRLRSCARVVRDCRSSQSDREIHAGADF